MADNNKKCEIRIKKLEEILDNKDKRIKELQEQRDRQRGKGKGKEEVTLGDELFLDIFTNLFRLG